MQFDKSQKYKLLTDTAKEDFNINEWCELNSQLVLKFERVSTSLELRCNFFVPFFEDTHSDKKPACRQTEKFTTIRFASSTKLSGKLSNPIKMSCNTKYHH